MTHEKTVEPVGPSPFTESRELIPLDFYNTSQAGLDARQEK